VDPFHPPEAGLEAVPLEVQVTSYEAIGGTLFLQGVIENGTAVTVTSASVLAAVRSIEGAPVTAGWRIVAATLEPAATVDFVLELALPHDVDLVTSEYDVVARGLAPQSARDPAPAE
jgi:hypothetical protein